jgi:nucleotide-binding universal stress UspA family protein
VYAPREIVVPIDFSEPSQAAVQRALGLARAFGTSIHLVHSLQYPDIGSYWEFDLPPKTWEATREQARTALLQLENELATEGVSVSSTLAETDPVSAIEAAVDQYQSNLIVMGTHGRSGFKHAVLGSVAECTLRTVNCPTLVVKETETQARRAIGRILVATDFSIHSKRAAMLACGLAEKLGASVDILHVVMLPSCAVGPYGIPPSDAVVEQLREKASELLQDATGLFQKSELRVESHLHQGLPSEVLASEAERLDADLIVMGTRGNTGLKHIFLGSVTERTLRTAPCSVMTTKDGDPI